MGKPVRAAFDLSPAAFIPAGINTYIWQLYNGLKALGPEEVEVLPARLPGFLEPNASRGFAHKLKVALWDTAYMQAYLPLFARRSQAEVLHAPAFRLPLASSVPVVTTIHDIIPLLFPVHRRRDRIILGFYLRKGAWRARHLLADSEATRQDIHRHIGIPLERITVVYPGVASKFQPLPRTAVKDCLDAYGIQGPYILSVGTIEPRKNLARVLEAFARLKESAKLSHRLVLVGKIGWMTGPVFETVKKLGIEQDLTFTGFVPEDDLPKLYNGASVFVYPALYEGFGLPLLEAMACGCPVITANTSSLPEVAGEAGILVDPRRPEQIAEALASVLEDPALAEDMAAKSLAQAQRFSWEKTARETVQVYRKVLAT